MSTDGSAITTIAKDWLLEDIAKPFDQIFRLETVVDNDRKEDWYWISTPVGEVPGSFGTNVTAKIGGKKDAVSTCALTFGIMFTFDNPIKSSSLGLLASAELSFVAGNQANQITSLSRIDWKSCGEGELCTNSAANHYLSLPKLQQLAGASSANIHLRVKIDVKLGRLEDGGDFLRSIFVSGYMSDFDLKVDDLSIPVHRVVLGKRSTVFNTMLASTEWKENQSASLTIEGFSKDAVIAMLEHLYCFPLVFERLEQACDVLAISEKYNLSALKKQCETSLEKLVNLENVCQLAVLADLHNAISLKNKCIQFATFNSRALRDSPSWNKLKIAEESMKK